MRDAAPWLVIIVILAIAIWISSGISYWVGFRDGQVDYANGRIGVVLEKQSDGSSVWKMK